MVDKKGGLPPEVVRIMAEATKQRAMYGLPSDVQNMLQNFARQELADDPATTLNADGVEAHVDQWVEDAIAGFPPKGFTEVVVVLDGSSDTPAGRRGGSSRKTLEYCAGLDHSDTDNAKRLLAHFPEHILVVAQEQAKEPFFAAWDGRHWDLQRGREKAFAFAQQIGALIEREVSYLKPDKEWQATMDAAKDALAVAEDERTPGQRKLVERAEWAKEQFAKRIKRRRDHAVSSKNASRLSAMLKCTWPHILKSPDDFNAHPLRFACQNATLTFERVSAAGSTKPASVRLHVRQDHRPEDLITHLFNADFDLQARCPQWLAFLERVLPDPEVRRLVQIASGLGLIGEKVQKLFFHYGAGANGKSVYMEVICRLLGEMAVTLPATSIIGEGGNSGGASPDLARLYGRRFLRVKELPEGEDLRESLVKELTGGETIVARNLFAGYMDFDPDFVAMMSGNGYPRIKGTDEGIWRRMAVVHWPVSIPEAERREFDDMVRMFEAEASGILNWLIEGAAMFLKEGIIIPDAVKRSTQEYRDSQDPTAAFVARCIEKSVTAEPVRASDLYDAYCRFTEAERGKPITNTTFGRIMGRKFERVKGREANVYIGLILKAEWHDDPPRYGDEPFPPDYED